MSATVRAAGGRSDARRNRELVVAAAREVFAAKGVDAPTREIARRAGLGIGTLYRHFPTREDLVDAVLAEAFEQFVATAEEALTDPDPWSGFTGFLERALLVHACNRGLMEVVQTQTRGRERADEMRRRIRPLIARLVARAQEQGTLRADFAPQDVALVFWASDRVIELAGDVAPEVWRRQLAFVLDGLKSTSPTAISQPPLTDAQLKRVGLSSRAGRAA